MSAQSPVTRVARVVLSPGALLLAILLLGASAVLGNVFQNVDRSSLKEDNRELKSEIQTLKQGNDELQHQLDLVKGEQECRSQIASEAEVVSGLLLAGVGRLLTASDEGDDAARADAIAKIADATEKLEPALRARQEAVETCAGSEALAPGAGTTTTTTTSSTFAVRPSPPTTRTTVRRRVTTTTTTPPGVTTSTTRPTSTTDPCLDLFGLVCL